MEGAAAASYYGVSNARTTAAFNESEVLTGFGLTTGVLHGWYTDEHAMTLGVDSIYVNNKNPTPDAFYGIFNNPADYAIAKMAGHLTGPVPQKTAGYVGSPFVPKVVLERPRRRLVLATLLIPLAGRCVREFILQT